MVTPGPRTKDWWRVLLLGALLLAGMGGAAPVAAQSGWTPVYNDGCDGEGHRVLVGKITARATLGDGCDLVVGHVAPDQRYAGEWVWGYSPTAGAVTHAAAEDAAYFRPHICDVLPRFPFAPAAEWQTRIVEPKEFLFALYGAAYPGYIAASCRMREQDTDFAQIGLDRALRPGSKLAEPPEPLIRAYNTEVLRRERVALSVPAGRLTMVFPGDSLSLFATVFDLPLAEIQAANQMGDPNALLLGQLLLIPGQGAATVAPPRPGTPPRLLCRLPLARSWPRLAEACAVR